MANSNDAKEIEKYVKTYYGKELQDNLKNPDYEQIMLYNSPGAKHLRLLDRLKDTHSWTEGWAGTALSTVLPWLGGLAGTLAGPGVGNAGGYALGTAGAMGIDGYNAALAAERADIYDQLNMPDLADAERLQALINGGIAASNLIPGGRFASTPIKTGAPRLITKNKQLTNKAFGYLTEKFGGSAVLKNQIKLRSRDLTKEMTKRTKNFNWGHELNRWDAFAHMTKNELTSGLIPKAIRPVQPMWFKSASNSNKDDLEIRTVAAHNLEQNMPGFMLLDPHAQYKYIDQYSQLLSKNPQYRYNPKDFSITTTNQPVLLNTSQQSKVNGETDSIKINGKNYGFATVK